MQKNYENFDTGKKIACNKLSYNFSPGPCILPAAVLERAAAGVVNYRGSNQSVMELSHRKSEFIEISDSCKMEIRKLLKVPDDFAIMLNQGGATMQYTAVIKNLIGLKPQKKAMYLTTGLWSQQCITEARRHAPEANIIEVANSKDSNYTKLPDVSTWKIDPEASYIHICVNETVHGFEITDDNFPWHLIPSDVPIVGDMSSNIATRMIDWKRYSVVYAGAQKNLGPTGVTLIIAKKSLFGKAAADTPIMCDWQAFENSPGSYYNTPPVWSIYVTALNCSYMNQMGGLRKYDRDAEIKSKMLYEVIDQSGGYYVNKTDPKYRSRINVNFRIEKNVKLEEKLIADAEKEKIINIRGHFSNPGIRISMYNAMPIEGVECLCKFLRTFQFENPIHNNARL
jgi:phosphoserine aminotransferase